MSIQARVESHLHLMAAEAADTRRGGAERLEEARWSRIWSKIACFNRQPHTGGKNGAYFFKVKTSGFKKIKMLHLCLCELPRTY